MTSSLIISTYNWPEALNLCLQSVLAQSLLPDEIIIADDGSGAETKKIIDQFRKTFKGTLKHVWHPDNGFRLAEIRNKAISVAVSQYIIQIDGDVILHKNFVEDHILLADRKVFVRGRRAMLSEPITKKLLIKRGGKVSFLHRGVKRREHAVHVPFFKFFSQESSANGVMGSNMGFWKKDFEEINGYNSALQGWGAEDKELAQRFVNLGMLKRKVKFRAIQFHLFHPESDKDNHEHQNAVIENIKNSKLTRAAQGLGEIKNDYFIYE